jgi:hypothetical protein
MTDPSGRFDDRPRPQYGEYADVPLAPPAPAPVEVAQPAAVAPRRRTWDIVLTTVLLLWGVADVVTGFPQFARLGTLVGEVGRAQGWPDFTSTAEADQVGMTLNIVRLVLLVLGIAGALLLLSRRRVAFWVPLTAGALAMVATVVGIVSVMVGDPAFLEYVQNQTG